MNNCWLAVASANHVEIGQKGGFMQVCHGKSAPLKRIKAGDLVTYYSPTAIFGNKDKLQAFTAIGIVQADESYQFDMGGGFIPYRKDVDWFSSYPTPIKPLLSALDFSAGISNWAYPLRFGLIKINLHDMKIIAHAMNATLPY